MNERDKNSSDQIHILIVDDEEEIRGTIQEAIQLSGYQCYTACSGEEALKILDKKNINVVITDIRMPGLSGIELTKRIKEKYSSDVIVMTGYAGSLTYEKVIEIGASDFVRKPVSPNELIMRLQRVVRENKLLVERNQAGAEAKRSFVKLQKALDQTVNALTSAVEMRDPYTSGHQRRVTQVACAIAEQMGFSADQIDGLRKSGLLHDIGKISVPSELLSKPGKLTAAEFSLIKDHPQTGYEILKGIEFSWPIAQIVLQHHERINGSGYPLGLSNEKILLEAKILCVSDVVEAMSSHRPYRPALGIDTALEEISRNKGILYEPDVADACLMLFKEKGFTIE